MIEALGWFSATIAVAGVVLNNYRRRACFVLWFFSNIICGVLHARAALWGLVARDVIFTVLAIVGWFQWGRAKK